VKSKTATATATAPSGDSGSGEERTGNAQAQPAPAPRSYYDPFTKKRVVIGSGSAAALGDSRAVKMGEAPHGATAAKPQQKKAKSKAKTEDTPAPQAARAPVKESPTSSDSSGSDDSSDDDKQTQGSKQSSAGPQQGAPRSLGGAKKSATPSVKKVGGAGIKSRSDSSSSSGSDSSDSETEANVKPSKPAAGPKSFYDPFAKKRITTSDAAADPCAGDKKVSSIEVRAEWSPQPRVTHPHSIFNSNKQYISHRIPISIISHIEFQ